MKYEVRDQYDPKNKSVRWAWRGGIGNPTLADITDAAEKEFPNIPFQELELSSGHQSGDVQMIFLHRENAYIGERH